MKSQTRRSPVGGPSWKGDPKQLADAPPGRRAGGGHASGPRSRSPGDRRAAGPRPRGRSCLSAVAMTILLLSACADSGVPAPPADASLPEDGRTWYYHHELGGADAKTATENHTVVIRLDRLSSAAGSPAVSIPYTFSRSGAYRFCVSGDDPVFESLEVIDGSGVARAVARAGECSEPMLAAGRYTLQAGVRSGGLAGKGPLAFLGVPRTQGAGPHVFTLSSSSCAHCRLKRLKLSPDAERSILRLSGMDFTGADLQGSTYTDVQWKGMDFTGADMTGTVFLQTVYQTSAQIYQCAFVGTDLDGSTFQGPSSNLYIQSSNLLGASARSAKFTNVYFDNTLLSGADMAGASLYNAGVMCSSDCTSCLDPAQPDLILEKASISGDVANFNYFVNDIACGWKEIEWNGTTFGFTFSMPADIGGVDFSNAVFPARASGVSPDGMDFTRVTNTCTDMDAMTGCAVFDGATLDGAKLNGSVLQGVSFDMASMKNAVFTGAALLNASFRNSDLTGAVLDRAVSPCTDMADLIGCSTFNAATLDGASLRSANLEGAEFRLASIKNGDFEGANLQSADFTGANMMAASFVSATLSQANLDGARLCNARMNAPTGVSAILSGAFMRNTLLANADLTGADLTYAGFFGDLVLADNTCSPSDTECGLNQVSTCASLAGAVLTNTNFGNAFLANVDLSESQIYGTIFNNATLVNANFRAGNIQYNPSTGTGSFYESMLQSADFTSAEVTGPFSFLGARANGDYAPNSATSCYAIKLPGHFTAFRGYWGQAGEAVCAKTEPTQNTVLPLVPAGTRAICPDGTPSPCEASSWLYSSSPNENFVASLHCSALPQGCSSCDAAYATPTVVPFLLPVRDFTQTADPGTDTCTVKGIQVLDAQDTITSEFGVISNSTCKGQQDACGFDGTYKTQTGGAYYGDAITDGTSTEIMTVTCLPRMWLPETNFSVITSTQTCTISNIPVQYPQGRIGVSCGNVTGGDCNGPKDSCRFDLTVAPGSYATTVSDSKTTAEMAVVCTYDTEPLALPISSFSQSISGPAAACNWTVPVQNARGPVSLKAGQGLSMKNSTCDGTQASCSFTLVAAPGTYPKWANSVTDGNTSAGIGCTCVKF